MNFEENVCYETMEDFISDLEYNGVLEYTEPEQASFWQGVMNRLIERHTLNGVVDKANIVFEMIRTYMLAGYWTEYDKDNDQVYVCWDAE